MTLRHIHTVQFFMIVLQFCNQIRPKSAKKSRVRGVSSTKIQVSVYCARTTDRNRIPAFYGEIRQVFSCF